MQEIKNIAATALQFVEGYMRPEVTVVTEPGTGTTALVEVGPSGVSQVSPGVFDAWRDGPARRKGTAQLTKIESLIEHVNRFKDPDSILFAVDDRAAPSITAVLDYHEAVNPMVEPSKADPDPVPFVSDAAPRFGQHRSVFAFPLSDEWKAWNEADGQKMTMAQFAAFLEDRIIDVLELIEADGDALPEDLQRFIANCGGKVASPNRLVELSRGLQVHEQAAVKETVNLSTGEFEISFVSEHVDKYGGKLQVPGLFLIGLPVFRHGQFYRLAARLRYNKTPAGLIFWFDLWRADRAFDDAFNEACELVAIKTALPLLFGKPE